METFAWVSDIQPSMSCKPTVETAKFGDGYEQRVAMGINSRMRTWSLKFSKNVSAILDFLEARNGEEAFSWTDPLGMTGNFICREWRVANIAIGAYSITCDFEQVTA